MMTKTEPSAPKLCMFLSRYCAALLASGATCIRLTKNVERIASTYGKRIEITIMPRHVHLTVTDRDGEELTTAIESVPAAPVSFNINSQLSQLSWQVHDNHLDFDELQRRYTAVMNSDKQNRWLVWILASLANASFCRLFGGDFVAMLTVFIATAAGYYMKQEMLARKIDVRVVFIACSFLSAVIATSDALFSVGTTPEIALGTSVLYLIPGIPFLNSFSDTLYRHYVCAFSRFVDAGILTCCLSAGLLAGMFLMKTAMF